MEYSTLSNTLTAVSPQQWTEADQTEMMSPTWMAVIVVSLCFVKTRFVTARETASWRSSLGVSGYKRYGQLLFSENRHQMLGQVLLQLPHEIAVLELECRLRLVPDGVSELSPPWGGRFLRLVPLRRTIVQQVPDVLRHIRHHGGLLQHVRGSRRTHETCRWYVYGRCLP